jgi:glutamate 5-kinase
MSTAPSPLAGARRVVVKIGSALLVDDASGTLRRTWLDALADDVARLRARGQDVVIVSSGAIALGRRQLGIARGPLRLEESQAAAAVGQIRLAHAYQDALAAHRIRVAQILLTLRDTERRRRYLNARGTMNTLLKLGAVPIVNENDTVATNEIRYGDNDRLAARVAQVVSADCLVLLSDVDGLYTADPVRDPTARFLPTVDEITPEIEAMAGASSTDMGSGGMTTKLMAARIAVGAGCHMAIASGKVDHPLRAIEDGARCTWFIPRETPLAARKQWIAGGLRPQGAVHIDAGAVKALCEGRSLLPAGVTAVEGIFERGDAVVILGPDGRAVARGLAGYSADDARAIRGRRTGEVEAILGHPPRSAMVHRDDLVLFQATARG